MHPATLLGHWAIFFLQSVGKTESVLLFTQHLFGTEEKLVRFDMSEFMNQSSLSILAGDKVGERGLFGHYYDHQEVPGPCSLT
jgi:ATP-dependent Clp protease ATP-binding subunit ClpA